MLRRLVFWLMGSRDYRVSERPDEAARLVTGSGANYRNLRRDAEGARFSLPLTDCRSVTRILANHGITAEVTAEHGLCYLLHRYRKRYGIAVGAVLFCAILFLSEQFIWTVEVVGNDRISAGEITRRFETLGVGVGTYIPGIDFDWVHNQMLIDYPDLAWAAVNVRGTRAVAEVREMAVNDPVPDEISPHNLIAAEDGIVRSVEILRGQPIAETDGLVRKGELLASGIEETKKGFKLVHARGRVMAEVKRTITVEIPLESVRREAVGREFFERYLNIFGFSVKFFGNTGNMPPECDTIIREHPLRVFGIIELPVSVTEICHRELADVTVTLTGEEAKAEAYRRLRAECAAATADGELLARSTSAGLRDGAYVIECRLTVLRNIAVEAPIYTD
ncbi:MAG: hypothetical protein E7632_02300 [Ruminococcaceae bacterium]|nr:hypothetical protein [Oscillospiraceae bacterium]